MAGSREAESRGMRTPRPLPHSLEGQALTPGALRAAGVDLNRLRRRDIAPIARGIRMQRSHMPVHEIERLRQRAVLLARERANSWISHHTAAMLRGWSIPGRLLDARTVHLTVLKAAGTYSRRDQVMCHRTTRAPRNLERYENTLISSPALTWLELAGAMSIEELVMLGDHIVRRPYRRYEGRSEPWTTLASLRDVVDSAAGMHGVKRARAAVDQVRIGADSAQETALRLALVNAGLPEPELQVRPDDDPWSPPADLGYRRQRIAIQYDGATHFDPERARHDQRRDNAFTSARWSLLRFNREDARDGFARAVAQVSRLLAS